METSGVAAWLERVDGGRVAIAGTCAIGRVPTNEIVLSFENVSRRHAIIHYQGQNEYWLVDLGSSNGTRVNRRRISQPVQLRDQDSLEIGPVTFRFRQPAAAPDSLAGGSGLDQTVREIKAADCWLLVTDIENSTGLARQVGAEKLPVVTGLWFSACKKIIDDHEGTINKFLGDGFFAYWRDSEGAEASVLRALAALTRLQVNAQPQFRLVVHHCRVLIGGAATLGEECLAGEGVNLLFRLEKLAGSLRLPRLASEAAQARLRGHLELAEAGRHSVAGFAEPVLVYSFPSPAPPVR